MNKNKVGHATESANIHICKIKDNYVLFQDLTKFIQKGSEKIFSQKMIKRKLIPCIDSLFTKGGTKVYFNYQGEKIYFKLDN